MKNLIVTAAFLLVCTTFVSGEDSKPMPTLLALRGELILDDDGSRDRSGKVTVKFANGSKLRAGAGAWERTPDSKNTWRSTWSNRMGHTPVMSYQGFEEKDLIVEVTFRYGVMIGDWHTQCFRIALDHRPDLTGHIVSAWANPNNDFIETGFLLQHIRKTPEKKIIEDLLLDHQSIRIEPNIWYTALVEVVGDEALFRMGNHVAYSKAKQIRATKNLVSLTLGKTWHDIKRVRIWKAETNPSWVQKKAEFLKQRTPFEIVPHTYKKKI